MPKVTKTLGNNKARACESRGFAHKKGCDNVLTQPPHLFIQVYFFLKCVYTEVYLTISSGNLAGISTRFQVS